MVEIFLILLAGGVMLAAATPDPRGVAPGWLRLAGIIALSLTGLAAYFAAPRINMWFIAVVAAIVGQLAFAQMSWRVAQRVAAMIAFGCAVAAGVVLLRQAGQSNSLVLIGACTLAASTCGLALMDMLLGHAYLNAASMTLRPFLVLNRALACALAARAVLSVGGTFVMQSRHPLEMFWNLHGLYVGTRWLVGFVVGGLFIYMAHDCIKRRATQSATGILYVAVVVIFIGEMLGLYVMSQTGMPL